jgi:hypothetical protein
VCALHSMNRFSFKLPGMMRSGHQRAGVTIAVGLTGTCAACVSSLRTMASLRRAVNQLQQTRATTTGVMGVVQPLGSLPRTVASLRRASTHPSSPVNPGDRRKSLPSDDDDFGAAFDNWSAAALAAFVLWFLTVEPEAWKQTFLFACYAGMTGWLGVGRFFVCLILVLVVFDKWPPR